MATQQEQQIGEHDAPVREVFVLDDMGMVVSASWDKTIRFWNCQQPAPVITLELPERCYAMDIKDNLMVVGCADRHILCYDLKTIQQNSRPYWQGRSALKMQTRCVSCFPDKTGYAVGSIEGRVSIAHIEEEKKDFAFKCHRRAEDVFAVNAIDFHPTCGTFATAGGDGHFCFWDKDARQRLKQFSSCHQSVTAAKFNASGLLFAYAACYDWSNGQEGNHSSLPRAIMVHEVEMSDIRPKSRR